MHTQSQSSPKFSLKDDSCSEITVQEVEKKGSLHSFPFITSSQKRTYLSIITVRVITADALFQTFELLLIYCMLYLILLKLFGKRI